MSQQTRHSTPPNGSLVRRSPCIGVSGVTLLMVVTLVLTSSPAFGRVRDMGSFQAAQSGLSGREAVSTAERAEQRLGGRRESNNRQIRPSRVGLARAFGAMRSARRPLSLGAFVRLRDDPGPGERLTLATLNLPPPAAA